MRIWARFHPQAWVNDHAIEVDPQGDVMFDVTDYILAMPQELALAIEDDDYGSDELRQQGHAPEWAQNWSGPFWVEVRDQIEQYIKHQKETADGGT